MREGHTFYQNTGANDGDPIGHHDQTESVKHEAGRDGGPVQVEQPRHMQQHHHHDVPVQLPVPVTQRTEAGAKSSPEQKNCSSAGVVRQGDVEVWVKAAGKYVRDDGDKGS